MERESAVDQRIRVQFGPLSADDSEPRTAQVPANLLPATPTVLVVDDEHAIRDFLRAALEVEGYNVLVAEDGLHALSLCECYWVDVILLDLMMPRLDGVGFLHRFRHRSRPDMASIYIMSAVRTAMEQASAAGVAGAFIKPFDLDELLDAIAVEVQRRRQAMAIEETAVPLEHVEPA
ncbi:MAG: response regulator [Chloroflexota bacterium]|nr:response regulator [Chloroflexota bacterium]